MHCNMIIIVKYITRFNAILYNIYINTLTLKDLNWIMQTINNKFHKGKNYVLKKKKNVKENEIFFNITSKNHYI